MKLRNKKTGEIGKLHCDMNVSPAEYGVFEDTDIRGHYWEYHSLAELNEEWEDYEEPKEYWYIDADGQLLCEPSDDRCEFDNNCREIGNYFENKEEAEKAVEKLKAWKRLKEARFEFTDFGYNLEEESSSIIGADGKICFNMLCYEDFADDLELLFGGEE